MLNGTAQLKQLFAKHGMYWITRAIAQGGYPDEEDCKALRAGGVTHLFNVDLPYLDPAALLRMGFAATIWKSVTDGQRLPDKVALDCLDTLNSILSTPGTKVYIHCHAGMNRSPTILWLYLIACGMGLEAAGELIAAASPYAVPGHPAMCDMDLVRLVQEHGRTHYLPLPRPEILQPWGE
jgi:hypothetical protein